MVSAGSGSPAFRVRVIGHPFAPSGMGEHCRSTALALSAVGISVELVDIHAHFSVHEEFMAEFEGAQSARVGSTTWVPPAVDIFTVNCDEMESVRQLFEARYTAAPLSVLYPAWELPALPDKWVAVARSMDALWVSSKYTQRAFGSSGLAAECVGLSVRSGAIEFVTRRDLSLPEGVHCALTSLHLASYSERKNPIGAARAVVEARERLSGDYIRLVVKVGGVEQHPDRASRLAAELRQVDPKVIVIADEFTEASYRGLLLACDSLLSLHRAEGFGFGLAEALRFGRPLVCTAYSGNMDYCSDLVAGMVNFDLVEVPSGAYPFCDGQTWADPDPSTAAEHLVNLVDDEENWEARILEGRVVAATELSHFAVGSRMQKSLQELMAR